MVTERNRCMLTPFIRNRLTGGKTSIKHYRELLNGLVHDVNPDRLLKFQLASTIGIFGIAAFLAIQSVAQNVHIHLPDINMFIAPLTVGCVTKHQREHFSGNVTLLRNLNKSGFVSNGDVNKGCLSLLLSTFITHRNKYK